MSKVEGPDASAKLGDDYLWDGQGAPDADVLALERALAPLAMSSATTDELAAARRRRRRRLGAGGVGALLAAAALAALLASRRSPEPPCARSHGFAFTVTSGVARCGGGAIARGELAPGATLETTAAEVRLTIADIGEAQVAPGSVVELASTGPREHRLRLVRGAMHARVDAVPRIFVVETPAAVATDLGCEYTLQVEPDGHGELVVLSGAVELTSSRGPVSVPAGMRSRLVPGMGGTAPLRDDAPAALGEAVATGVVSPATIEALRAEDAVTWLHLALADASLAEVVHQRLQELGVPGGARDADPASLRRWIDELIWRAPTAGSPGKEPWGKGTPRKAAQPTLP
ncbi:MAG: FecR family protein [Kofleriaceae bacterium]